MVASGEALKRDGCPHPRIALGILMLETEFERLPGDIGNALTWDFPVLYKVVPGLTQDRFFRDGAKAFLSEFLGGCDELASLGARGVLTSCGFSAALQPELSARSPIPVATSPLLQIPMVQSLIGPGRRVGVVTTDAAALSDKHFAGVGVTKRPPVVGLPLEGEIRRHLRTNATRACPKAQEADLIAAARSLLRDAPDLGAIVLECTNLAPHSAALRRATGLPVFDEVTLGNWLHAALNPESRWGFSLASRNMMKEDL